MEIKKIKEIKENKFSISFYLIFILILLGIFGGVIFAINTLWKNNVEVGADKTKPIKESEVIKYKEFTEDVCDEWSSEASSTCLKTTKADKVKVFKQGAKKDSETYNGMTEIREKRTADKQYFDKGNGQIVLRQYLDDQFTGDNYDYEITGEVIDKKNFEPSAVLLGDASTSTIDLDVMAYEGVADYREPRVKVGFNTAWKHRSWANLTMPSESGTIDNVILFLKTEGVAGSVTMNMYQNLRTGIVEAEADWAGYTTGDTWSSGGGSGVGTDYDNTLIDATSSVAAGNWLAIELVGGGANSDYPSLDFGDTAYLYFYAASESGNNYWGAYSREDATASNRPYFEVTYTPAVPDTTEYNKIISMSWDEENSWIKRLLYGDFVMGLGYGSGFSNITGFTASYVYMEKFTASSTFDLSIINFYSYPTTTPNEAIVAVYSASSTSSTMPWELLSTSDVNGTNVVDGWNSFSVPTTTIQIGESYFLAGISNLIFTLNADSNSTGGRKRFPAAYTTPFSWPEYTFFFSNSYTTSFIIQGLGYEIL